MRRGLVRLHKGFLLLEALLGVAIASSFFLAVTIALIGSQEGTVAGGNRVRGAFLSEYALEVSRSIRDDSFLSLSDGSHGVRVATNGTVSFTGSRVTMTGGYITSLLITSPASDWKRLTATTKWKLGYARSGSVVLFSELTDWRGSGQVGNWSTITLEGSVTEASGTNFSSVAVSGHYVLVGSSVAGGGAGLYIYDISSLTTPNRVNASFMVGYDVQSVVVCGSMLYLLTNDASGEIKAYRIGSLPTVTYVTSYNLPGSALGTSLTSYGYMLYASSTYSVTNGEKEFYAFDVSSSGSITLKSSLDDTGTLNAVGLSGTSAYLGSTLDASELRVLTLANSGSIALAGGGAYNVSGTEDGLAVAVSGSSALLGRTRGTSIQEFVMFKIPNGGVPTSPGPYYRETSGSVLSIAAEPSGCYAFAATQQKYKALQVIKIGDTSLPEAAYYTLSSSRGRAVTYDMVRDRVYLVTDESLMIFKPAAATGSC